MGSKTLQSSKWEKPILSFILAFIHHIIDVLMQIWLYANVLIKKLIRNQRNIGKEFTSLQKSSKKQLTKVPAHIALAFLESSISLEDVAKLIMWNIASGVQGISLYDVRGFLKFHQDELKDCVEELCKFLDDPCHINWNLGARNRSAVTICLLSREDGQEDIVKAARKVAQTVANGDMKVDDVDESVLETYLNKGLPDPEVLLRFGLSHSNQGFPPWQIRLSEIHDIDTHHGVTCGDFFQILLKYSKCQQRFGR